MSTPTSGMTSTGFVAYAIAVSRESDSWDAAELAFTGPARWEAGLESPPQAEIVESERAPVLVRD